MFYVVAASEHGRRVNTSKARGDQTGYLWDAENVYANWHGRQPPVVIGERNRMPLYAGFLAIFYHRDLSDPAFFEVAKKANIYLSLALVVLLAVIFFRELPPLEATNLTGIVAFGIFIFKAGYAQSELLFYFLMFVTFLGCWHLLRSPTSGGRQTIVLAAGIILVGGHGVLGQRRRLGSARLGIGGMHQIGGFEHQQQRAHRHHAGQQAQATGLVHCTLRSRRLRMEVEGSGMSGISLATFGAAAAFSMRDAIRSPEAVKTDNSSM